MTTTLDRKPRLTKQEEEQLRIVLTEIAYRKRVNPLSFFEHFSLQEDFHNDTSNVKCAFGGNRSGKTEEASEYIIRKALEKPKQRIWACAETFSDSVNIQQRKVNSLVPKNHIRYGRYDEINGYTNRKLCFDNRSIVHFKSYDQGREAFAQDDIDLIWNDEEPPYEIYKEQRMRLIDRNGQMIITMTSLKGITDLIADIFDDYNIIKTQYAPLVKKELPRIAEKNGIKFYFFWTPENPYINQGRVKEEVKLMPMDEILCRMYGLPINLSGKIYMQFNKNIHVIPFDDTPEKNVTLYHVLDPHDRKPWAMQWWIVDATGTCYCIDEYPNRDFNEMMYDDKSYDDYASIIRQKENALFDIYGKEVFKRIIDPNFGNKTVQLAERVDGRAHTSPKEELKKRGFKFQDGIDAIEAGHLAVRQYLHWEMKGTEIVVQPKVLIAEHCINTIKHISRYSRKDITSADGDVKDKVAPQEKYKDFNDCLRYFIMSNPKHVPYLKQFVPELQKTY